MAFSFETWALTQAEISSIQTILYQYVGTSVCTAHEDPRKVLLHTALPGIDVQAAAKVVVLDPIDGFESAVYQIGQRVKDTIVICLDYDRVHRFRLGVNNTHFPTNMIEFPE